MNMQNFMIPAVCVWVCVCVCGLIRGFLLMDVCWCWRPVTVIWRLSLTHCRRVCLCMWAWKRGYAPRGIMHSAVSPFSHPSAFRRSTRLLCSQRKTVVWRTRQTGRHTRSHKGAGTSSGFSRGRFCVLSEINKCICVCVFGYQCHW